MYEQAVSRYYFVYGPAQWMRTKYKLNKTTKYYATEYLTRFHRDLLGAKLKWTGKGATIPGGGGDVAVMIDPQGGTRFIRPWHLATSPDSDPICKKED